VTCDRQGDGLVDFAISVASMQLVIGATFTALTVWIDRPFETYRRDALTAFACCGTVTFCALSFLLRRNWGRVLQAGAYALATVALGAGTPFALAESVVGAAVIIGAVAIAACAARAYVSPEVRQWTTSSHRDS
jgi:hypothetical protein